MRLASVKKAKQMREPCRLSQCAFAPRLIEGLLVHSDTCAVEGLHVVHAHTVVVSKRKSAQTHPGRPTTRIVRADATADMMAPGVDP
jgi:hypothetical protein